MLPLLYKDGLTSACVVLTFMFSLVTYAYNQDFWPSLNLVRFKIASNLTQTLLKFLVN
jgi:hypothetical protein